MRRTRVEQSVPGQRPGPDERLELGAGEVHVWSFSLGEVPRGDRREAARTRSAEILGRYLGLPGEAVALVRADPVKPRLAGGELEFNLSHSGTLAVLAVAGSLPVGVDLEARRDSIDLERGIRDRCTAREGDWVRGAADPHDAWVRLWARKEAVVKASGAGVLDQLHLIDVLDELVLAPARALTGVWRCRDLPAPAPELHLALAHPALGDVRVVQRAV